MEQKKAVGKGVAADAALPVKRVTATVDTSASGQTSPESGRNSPRHRFHVMHIIASQYS